MINFYNLLSARSALTGLLLWLTCVNANGQLTEKIERAPMTDYIVVYKTKPAVLQGKSYQIRQDLMRDQAMATLAKYGLSDKKVPFVYDAVLGGFAVAGLTGKDLALLRKDPLVSYIVPDTPMYPSVEGPAAILPLAGSCSGPVVTLNGVSTFDVGLATFGGTAPVTGEVVLVNDGTGTPTFGCSPILNSLTGKIALIDRGTCEYGVKALNAQNAGAIGVIIANIAAGDPPSMGPGASGASVTIPVMSITLADANALKAALGSTVTATLDRGSLDLASSQCVPWGITRVKGGLSGVGKRAWIIDTGIDLDHPDLNVNTTLSQSFVAGLTSPDDQNGHGSHVSGTIAALDNGIGVVGVAAGAEVVAVRVFAATGGSATSVIAAGMNYVYNYLTSNPSPNDVVNMSLGGDANRAMEEAVFALQEKCRVVVSAGNDAKDANFQTPARVNAPNLYTVSAANYYNKLASFSNYGNAPVDYAAPGVNIASCYKDGGYAYLSGTSMASPHVAGLLLLGPICTELKAIGDPDGEPDPIAVHYDPATAPDNDLDGYSVCEGDLDDNNIAIHPGVAEVCGDGLDNNSDGQIDEGCCPGGGGVTRLYVNVIASGANSGLSWTDAFTSLQSALTAAKKCTEVTQIWVAKGTYYPSADQFGQTSPTNPRTKSFSLRNGLAIYGGFAGGELAGYDLSLRDLVNNESVLNGDIDQNNQLTNDVYHVFLNIPLYPTSLNATAILDGFAIVGGLADATVVVSGATQFTFPNSYGGGVINYSSSPTIANCVFETNAGYLGGAISNNESSPALTKVSFLSNQGQYGGGIFNTANSSPLLTSSSFKQNTALTHGGGMYNDAAPSIIITNTSFSGNTASSGYGGGFYSYGTPATITNSSFLGNSAQFGGGVLNEASSPVMTNVSFSGNKGTSNGGAIYNYNGSSPVINNSIFWGNSSEINNQTASIPTVSYSIVQGGWSGAGTNNLNKDPRFVSQPPIGPTITGDLALIACSPAINTGDPATTSGTVGTTDLSGNSRIFGARIDMGAYEFQGAPVVVTIAANPGLAIAPGGSTTLTASGAVSYLWSTTETTAGITVSPAITTAYTVTGTTPACSITLSATVTVAPPRWAGTAGTNWNTPGNWESGTVPLPTHDVEIPSAPTNQPVISSAAVAKSVTVNAGASLTISATHSLTINGSTGNAFSNSGTVNNSGSLIIGNTDNIGANAISNSGTFNNNAGGSIATDRFHDKGILNELLSSPTPFAPYDNTFTNNGNIVIGAIVGNNFGIENIGTFINASGSINIPSANNSGIHNVGPFTNNAIITIKTVLSGGPGRGIFNQNLFTNNSGGSITINRSLDAISNDGSFTNLGKIDIGNSTAPGEGVTRALRNETAAGSFDNTGCLAIITTSANFAFTRPFTNSGKIIENSASNSSLVTTNSGVIQNLGGGTFSVTTNTGINTTTTGDITQPDRLTVTIAPDAPTITVGQQVTLTASGGTSYKWNDPSGSTTNPLVITPVQGQTTFTVVGLTGFCTGTASTQVTANPLPVTLISFDAKKQSNGSVKLTWLTASEVDNAHFELERSLDLKKAELLAKVAADQNSAQTHTYHYTDELPYQGTSYYRLRQVDLDGRTTTYGWVSVISDQTYTVFPNPVAHNNFKLRLDEPNNAVLKFYGVDGKAIPLQTVSQGTGVMELKVPKNSPAGVYLLQVEERAQIRTYRLVVE